MVFYLAYRYSHIVGNTDVFFVEAGHGCGALYCNGICFLPCFSIARRQTGRFQPAGCYGKSGYYNFFKELYIGNDSGIAHINRAVPQIADGIEKTEDAKAYLWDFGDVVQVYISSD